MSIGKNNNTKNILRNITPAFVVMIVGLAGAYFVYNNYFSEKVSSELGAIQPAAGEDMKYDSGETAPAAEAAPAAEGVDAAASTEEGEVKLESAGAAATGEAPAADAAATEEGAAKEGEAAPAEETKTGE